MKNFFENVKEFCSRNFKQISFAVFVALGTIFALLSNYAANQGYGNLFMPVNDSEYRHTYHNERYHDERRDRDRNRNTSKRQPWTMQKPDRSSKSSNSSNHK